MKQWQAVSLVEHPGHGDQSVHGHRSSVYMVSHVKTTSPISNKDESSAITFHRKNALGERTSSTHKGLDATGRRRVQKALDRVNALAAGKKAILKRQPPKAWGDVQSGYTHTSSFVRRAGK